MTCQSISIISSLSCQFPRAPVIGHFPTELPQHYLWAGHSYGHPPSQAHIHTQTPTMPADGMEQGSGHTMLIHLNTSRNPRPPPRPEPDPPRPDPRRNPSFHTRSGHLNIMRGEPNFSRHWFHKFSVRKKKGLSLWARTNSASAEK